MITFLFIGVLAGAAIGGWLHLVLEIRSERKAIRRRLRNMGGLRDVGISGEQDDAQA